MTVAPVSDEELILYHFREGLPHERLDYIEHELAHSPLLKRRYDKLRAVFAAVDREPAPKLSADFEERVWSRLQARIHASPHGREIEPRSRGAIWSRWNVRLASAAAAVLTIAARMIRGPRR